MAKLGGLLMALAMVGLFAIIVIPVLPMAAQNTTIDRYLEPLLCGPGETIVRDQYSQQMMSSTSYSMTVACRDLEGQMRDVTDRWTLIGMLTFTVPFVLGLLLFIAGMARNKPSSTTDATAVSAPVYYGGSSLTARLKDLQQARDAGLISEGEYERKRQEVLDNN